MGSILGRFLRMVILTIKQLQDPYYNGFAAQIAFYLLLSIVPIVLLIVQLLGVFGISTEMALSMIEEYTGRQMSTMVSSLFQFNSIGFGNVIFIVIALWAGSRVSFSISRITNYTLSSGKTTGKNYFFERGRAITTIFLTIITLVISIVILCYGKVIVILIFDILNISSTEYIDSIWMALRWPLGFVLYFLVISTNYYFLPTQKVPYRRVLPGALFSALGMVVVSLVYSTYTSSLANYDLMYGALSSVVAIMMWFLFISWVIILGVMVNKVLEDTKHPYSKQEPPDYPNRKGPLRHIVKPKTNIDE